MRLTIVISPLIALSVLSCSNYQISLNEQVIYEPPKLFADYQISDQDLKECVRASIAEQDIIEAKQLKSLSCPGGNIISLNGLEIFTQLRSLGLANNKITDIEALADIAQLRHIDLRNNALSDVIALQMMPSIESLNVEGNKGLTCEQVKQVLTSLNEHSLSCDE